MSKGEGKVLYISQKACIVFGGSFNPLHVGHMRIALELQERLQPQHFLFLPCAVPPHKEARTLLPFDLRVELLQRNLAAYPFFTVSCIEAERSGPSYSFDSIQVLQQIYPDCDFYFILGSDELASLQRWYKWESLLAASNFILLPRVDQLASWKNEFAQFPVKESKEDQQPFDAVFEHEYGKSFFCISIPYVRISASLIREYWCMGRSVDYLLSNESKELLLKNEHRVQAHWCL